MITSLTIFSVFTLLDGETEQKKNPGYIVLSICETPFCGITPNAKGNSLYNFQPKGLCSTVCKTLLDNVGAKKLSS